MTMSMKLKSLLYSFFQPNNSYLIQKSMRHADASARGSSSDEREDYMDRRKRNNDSVRRSRAKSRAITQECATVVKELKLEQIQLTNQLESLQSELSTLKSLFRISYNYDHLSFKPSDVPTSTLYKLIMNQGSSAPEIHNSSGYSSPAMSPLSSSNSSSPRLEPELYTNSDNFYITQIKNSLSSVLGLNSKSEIQSGPDLRKSVILEHDYSNVSS
ncbi:basic region leucine zipper [Brachionus plicatilis]|uniref:Basic region leucine zipper n=1 Tax=Brachionus plicatilis TaxID=10195 RepID=A0A3M7SL27_BRAPC|nr:basic region leucine zipper [Brachionus plicatilis]